MPKHASATKASKRVAKKLGLRLLRSDTSALSYHLKPVFIFPAHVSCIKAVAASPHGGKWLATGSADEIVKVWDLRRRKEIGGLMHHEGPLNNAPAFSISLAFAFCVGGWHAVFIPGAGLGGSARAARAQGEVNSVAVHPSGKVALSVGKDRTLRMWDLMRGKGCASTKLGKEAELVRWSSDGSLFVVQVASTIDVYTTDMNLIHTINHPSASKTSSSVTRKRLRRRPPRRCRGQEAVHIRRLYRPGKTTPHHRSDDRARQSVSAPLPTFVSSHPLKLNPNPRSVKAVQTLPIALPAASGRTSTTIVCTVSSDGKIFVYDLAALPAQAEHGSTVLEISPVAEYDSKGTRLTCVTLADGDGEDVPVNGKRKRADEDGEEGAESAEGGGCGMGRRCHGDVAVRAAMMIRLGGRGEEEGEDEDEAEVESD
ncbi:WD40-repeat-containing domain protein [Mycena leptocephala]|nr:WD40-repeat-containing domain protein [Mycena leptocephala]